MRPNIRKTNFDQIPVTRVKEIMIEGLPENYRNEFVHDTETHDGAMSDDEGWRAVANRIQVETDTTKLIALVQQLIARFDEQQRITTVHGRQKPDVRETSAV
jgi:hypothetical protein